MSTISNMRPSRGPETPGIKLFYYEWPSTAGNHAGMAYFARRLKHHLGCPVQLIAVPRGYAQYRHRVRQSLYRLALEYTARFRRPGDIIFFTEYLSPGRSTGFQSQMARDLRARGVDNRIVGLVHLPPRVLLDMHAEAIVRDALSAADQIVVMGSSLERFFADMGYGPKVKRTFYYVDTAYYRPAARVGEAGTFRAVITGSLYRDPRMLRDVVVACPEIHFDLCMGRAHLEAVFQGCENVALYGYLPEPDLRAMMQQSDVHLSVLDDTVANNAIVTALACGLPQVVSDVGSIRDYCSDDEAIFCRTPEDFARALHRLRREPDLCRRMSAGSRRRAEGFSLEKSIDWYRDLFGSRHEAGTSR